MNARGKSLFVSILSIVFCIILTGCGYSLRGAKNPLHSLGIRKIHISNFRNNTYRPGIEYYFSKAMVQEVERYDAFEITNNPEEADAIISGSISGIQVSAVTKNVRIDGDTTAAIASSFNGSISCTVTMSNKHGREIFNVTFSGSKAFPASLVVEETDNEIIRGSNDTTPLFNDSEQRLSIRFLATQLMADAYQKLTDIF